MKLITHPVRIAVTGTLGVLIAVLWFAFPTLQVAEKVHPHTNNTRGAGREQKPTWSSYQTVPSYGELAAAHLTPCASFEDCAPKGCEYRLTDDGAQGLVCRSADAGGCERLMWMSLDAIRVAQWQRQNGRSAHPIPLAGPWHCPAGVSPPTRLEVRVRCKPVDPASQAVAQEFKGRHDYAVFGVMCG